MFREVRKYYVLDKIMEKKEVYAICRNGEEVEVKLAKDIPLGEYADVDKHFYVEWVEGEEDE